jgi:hypothetical protein
MKTLFEAFTQDFDLDVFTKDPNYQTTGKKEVLIKIYPTVNSADYEPVNIINPDIDKGPWIAGGACLRWYQDLPVGDSDIDVFCRSDVQADRIINEIKSYSRYEIKYESENATTIRYWSLNNKSWIIQIIKRRYFSTAKDIIDNFDITVCQAATDGKNWVLGDNFAKDCREKNLRFSRPLQPDAVKRLTKYWTYGYRPVDGLIDEIINSPGTRWSFALDEDYQNAF